MKPFHWKTKTDALRPAIVVAAVQRSMRHVTWLAPWVWLLGVPGSVFAQDAHYWTYQYGTRATLLGGAVVGSVLDISATFYNPGALALIVDPELVATSKVFELNRISVGGEAEPLFDLSQFQLGFAPGFFGGIAPFKFLGDRHVLGYSVFTRFFMKAKLDAFEAGRFNRPSDGVPVDAFGEMRLETNLNETWVGLTWSYRTSSKTGIGATAFVTSRSQSGEGRTTVQALADSGDGALSTRQDLYSYWNYGILLKAGATFEFKNTSFGLTVTTPRLSAFGQGRVVTNAAGFGQDVDLDGVPDPTFAAGVAEGLAATSRSAWSIALGASRALSDLRVHFTAEYFSALDPYDVLPPTQVIAKPSGDTLQVRVRHGLRDVLNAGAGAEYTINDRLSTFFAFRTDFSARRPEETDDVSISSWDILFGTAGVALRIGTAGLTLGAAYGGGGDLRSLDSLRARVPPNLSELLPQDLALKYRSVRFIFTLSI